MIPTPIFTFSGGENGSATRKRLCSSRLGDGSGNDLQEIPTPEPMLGLPQVSPDLSNIVLPRSYASSLLNPLNQFQQTMTKEFTLGDEDFTVSKGTCGPKICFSQRVEDKLDFDWQCAMIIKLMGKPNTANAFKFMFDGLKRK